MRKCELIPTTIRYNDDEPGHKTASAPVYEQPAPVQPVAEVIHETTEQPDHDIGHNGGDHHMNNDDDEYDDDDIDFNLGDGPATTGAGAGAGASSSAHYDERPSQYNAPPPPPPPSRGPNAKEDG